ncbi:hypothetical protein HaLaN_04030, partial [Haematococcus lacustris]
MAGSPPSKGPQPPDPASLRCTLMVMVMRAEGLPAGSGPEGEERAPSCLVAVRARQAGTGADPEQ